MSAHEHLSEQQFRHVDELRAREDHPTDPRTYLGNDDHYRGYENDPHKAFEQLKSDIKNRGVLDELTIAGPTDNTIINGHHRWQAARELGIRRVPVEYSDYSP